MWHLGNVLKTFLYFLKVLDFLLLFLMSILLRIDTTSWHVFESVFIFFLLLFEIFCLKIDDASFCRFVMFCLLLFSFILQSTYFHLKQLINGYHDLLCQLVGLLAVEFCI